jgi:hypothetical protein
MNINWRRKKGDLEHELRAGRPEPKADFLSALSDQVREETRRNRFGSRPRLALAGALTAAMLAAVGAFGGFGYAATAAKEAVDAVSSILIASNDDPIEVDVSSGSDQYQAAFAWGDPSQNHDGAPGLSRKGGELAPPLVASCTGEVAVIQTSIVLDEQADLKVSVVGPDGEKLMLVQKSSDGDSVGKKTKTLRYRVLVPRTVKISLQIPCSVLKDGAQYRIVVKATDPDGNTSNLKIPFRALNLAT